MDTHTTISSTEARQKFAEIIDRVQESGARYTITVNGKPKVVLMDADELEDLLDTLDILSDTELLERLKKSQEEIANGEYIELDEMLAQYGL